VAGAYEIAEDECGNKVMLFTHHNDNVKRFSALRVLAAVNPASIVDRRLLRHLHSATSIVPI
jgi:hypothetical protein